MATRAAIRHGFPDTAVGVSAGERGGSRRRGPHPGRVAGRGAAPAWPRESILVVPVSGGLPLARVDLLRTAKDREQVLGSLRGPYDRNDRNARPGAAIAVVCVTEDRRGAELASQHLAAGLDQVGVTTHVRLWATDERWVELNTGVSGNRTPEAASPGSRPRPSSPAGLARR